jgi:hypothetical protein
MPDMMSWETVAKLIVLFVSAFGTVTATVYTLCKIVSWFKKANATRMDDFLARHCPNQHKPIFDVIERTQARIEKTSADLNDRMDRLQENFGHELGELKNIIIQNSPNGSIKKIFDRLDVIEEKLPKSKAPK